MRTRSWKLLLTVLLVNSLTLGVSGQFLKDTYRFNNTLSVSAPDCGSDLLHSQAPGGCIPASSSGGFFENVSIAVCGVTRPVYHNNLNWGLQYSNTDGTIGDTYTIHIFLRTLVWGNLPWTRIIDFSNGISDNGIYFKKQTTSDDRCLDFYPNGM